MRRNGRVLFILGFVLAVLSALGLYALLITSKPPPATVPTTKLVVAFQSVTERSEIGAAQVGVVDWPETLPTPIGAYASPSDAIGKLAKGAIYPGQPILDEMLIDKADVKQLHSNASLVVDESYRALALPVKIDTNVAEAVQAGDRIDLIATFTVQPVAVGTGATAPAITKTHRLLEDVLVLQVGPWPNTAEQPKEGGDGSYTVVTLLLNLQDAQVVKFAQLQADDVSMVLRHANDHTVDETEPVTIQYLNKRFGYNFPLSGQ